MQSCPGPPSLRELLEIGITIDKCWITETLLGCQRGTLAPLSPPASTEKGITSRGCAPSMICLRRSEDSLNDQGFLLACTPTHTHRTTTTTQISHGLRLHPYPVTSALESVPQRESRESSLFLPLCHGRSTNSHNALGLSACWLGVDIWGTKGGPLAFGKCPACINSSCPTNADLFNRHLCVTHSYLFIQASLNVWVGQMGAYGRGSLFDLVDMQRNYFLMALLNC